MGKHDERAWPCACRAGPAWCWPGSGCGRSASACWPACRRRKALFSYRINMTLRNLNMKRILRIGVLAIVQAEAQMLGRFDEAHPAHIDLAIAANAAIGFVGRVDQQPDCARALSPDLRWRRAGGAVFGLAAHSGAIGDSDGGVPQLRPQCRPRLRIQDSLRQAALRVGNRRPARSGSSCRLQYRG